MHQERIALSVKEAAAATCYSEHAIRRAIREKRLTAVRPGGKGDYRIFRDDLYAWLRGESAESAA